MVHTKRMLARLNGKVFAEDSSKKRRTSKVSNVDALTVDMNQAPTALSMPPPSTSMYFAAKSESDKPFDPQWSVRISESGISNALVAGELVEKFITPVDRKEILELDSHELASQSNHLLYMAAAYSRVMSERLIKVDDELLELQGEVSKAKEKEQAAIEKAAAAEGEIQRLKNSRVEFVEKMKVKYDQEMEKFKAEYEDKLEEVKREKEACIRDAISAYKSSFAFTDDVEDRAGNMFMTGWNTHRNLTLKAHPSLDLSMVDLPDDLDADTIVPRPSDCHSTTYQ